MSGSWRWLSALAVVFVLGLRRRREWRRRRAGLGVLPAEPRRLLIQRGDLRRWPRLAGQQLEPVIPRPADHADPHPQDAQRLELARGLDPAGIDRGRPA